MNPLILHLKYEFYDRIKNGSKRCEYREYKPYWKKRIKNQKEIIFVPGYGLDNSLNIKAEISEIIIRPKWMLPEYVKRHFKDSKYNKFFVIRFKVIK